MANFQWERLLMALGAVGAMDVALERTLRVHAGAPGLRPPAHRPPGRPPPARRAGHDRARLALRHLRRAAALLRRRERDQGGHDGQAATQRASFEVMDACLQLHGGAGYMREYGIERMARDARLGPIGGGTDEVMKEILSKLMGL